jgi:hypothetical protein
VRMRLREFGTPSSEPTSSPQCWRPGSPTPSGQPDQLPSSLYVDALYARTRNPYAEEVAAMRVRAL